MTVKASDIIENMKRLTAKASIWQETGSVHVAQLVYKDQFITREDVSRHVAVDKVIGAAAKAGFDLSRSYVCYSGRMPADMLIKIVRVGIPILVSNAAPAGSGYEIAKKGNITMIGFVRDNRFNLYNAYERIDFLILGDSYGKKSSGHVDWIDNCFGSCFCSIRFLPGRGRFKGQGHIECIH